MANQLPLMFRQRSAALFERYSLSGAAMVRAAEDVSLRYRRTKGEIGAALQITSGAEAAAYACVRMPATYAAVADAMGRLRSGYPDFAPHSVLDIGAGCGGASFAVQSIFENVERVTLLEPNTHLRQVGAELAQGLHGDWEWLPQALGRTMTLPQADLVVVSYVLNEVSHDDIRAALPVMWAACSGALVILEPGTPHGAGVIAHVRDWARGQTDAHIVAPCPQSGACPLTGSDRWCHFSVRVERSRLHKSLKEGSDLGYEDEKFSYIIVTRKAGFIPSHRIIGHPAGKKVRELQVCGRDEGAVTLVVPKSHALYAATRKLEWGDGFDG